MRTYVQDCRNAVFVFSGSQKSMMSEMFSSPARPFYQSVSLMFLKPVALPEYEIFAQEHFDKAGKTVADGVVKAIYERFDGTTWYLQKVLNQLFATKDSVIVSDVEKAVEQITGWIWAVVVVGFIIVAALCFRGFALKKQHSKNRGRKD